MAILGPFNTASPGAITMGSPISFIGNFLIGGFTGITWAQNIFLFIRDYYDSGISNPYKGQVFPTGGNSGGPGQIYPF